MPEKGFRSCFDKVLVHLPDHGVVVCRACRFAVQPKALPSHLLRHQIYRDERRQLLQQCSKLNLLEPEEVTNPQANANPLPYLSVQRGFRCEAGECEHTCVSSKRMSQHWSESHHESDSRNVEAKPVYLQTFFRGNKIRYFEVNGPGNGQLETNETQKRSTNNRTSVDEDTPQIDSLSVSNTALAMSWESPSYESSSPPEEEQPLVHLDFDNLQYFHQYMTETCVTLRRGESESSTFWRVDIVKEAFKYPFLMHGILGVAAAHLTMLNVDNLSILEIHRQASLRYQQAALVDFRSAMREPDTENSTALIAFGRVIGVQTGVQHQITHIYPHLLNSPSVVIATTADPSSFPPDNIMDNNHPYSLTRVLETFHLLRGVGEMLLAFQPLLPHGSDFLLSEEVLEGLRDHQTCHSSNLGGDGLSPEDPAFTSFSCPYSGIELHGKLFGNLTLEDLARKVPNQAVRGLLMLEERVGGLILRRKAAGIEGVGRGLNLGAAAKTLVIAYAQSYAGSCSGAATTTTGGYFGEGGEGAGAGGDASWARWNGAEGWLRRAPEYYVRMLSAGDPAALVVFAYWCPLLKRLEDDYWFLRGQAAWLTEIVTAHLPDDEWRGLIAGVL